MLWSQRQINWNDYDPRFKRGTVVAPERQVESVSYVDKRTGETRVAENVERRVWSIAAAPIFTQDRELLAEHIPLCPDTASRATA